MKIREIRDGETIEHEFAINDLFTNLQWKRLKGLLTEYGTLGDLLSNAPQEDCVEYMSIMLTGNIAGVTWANAVMKDCTQAQSDFINGLTASSQE